jgi:hypothetical protein
LSQQKKETYGSSNLEKFGSLIDKSTWKEKNIFGASFDLLARDLTFWRALQTFGGKFEVLAENLNFWREI